MHGTSPTTLINADAIQAVQDINAALIDASPSDIVRAALRLVGREQLASVSSFGIESAAFLKVIADVDPTIPVLFLDTGHMFEETLAYKDELVMALGLRDVRVIRPSARDLRRTDPENELWMSDPDACCRIRKVQPLAEVLVPFGAWLNGRQRFQGGVRAAIPVVEQDGARLKFNPLAYASREDLAEIYARAKLPVHPLLAKGFSSVGCIPCTTRTGANEDARAGRWRGHGKTECGIHSVNVK